MLSAGLDGILCQVLLFTSSVFLARNQVTVEFTTPANAAPSSMLLCFNHDSMVLNASNFGVVSLWQGGSLFSLDETQVLDTNSQSSVWFRNTFFRSSSSGVSLDAASYGTLRDVTSTDPFYAGSYKLLRLDDFWRDWRGQTIDHLVQFPPPAASEPSYTPHGNCVLLTGAWQQGTRYELTVEVTNPAPHTNDIMEPMPALWIAAVTAQSIAMQLPNGQHVFDVSFAVRGDKHGTVCQTRSPAAGMLGWLWDPCRVLANFTQPSYPPYTDKPACLAQLAGMGGSATQFPFNQPPLASYNTSSFAQSAQQCGPQQVLSPRFGGVCVDCEPAGTKVVGEVPCQCPHGSAPAAVGPTLCSYVQRSNGSLAEAQALAASLCAAYTTTQSRWEARHLSSKIVARLVFKAFLKAAASLIDEADVRAANATFYSHYVTDDRHATSPTRTAGVKPQCNKCNGSTFKDTISGKPGVLLFDYQFDAMNTFRFMGYLLDQVVGAPCPALWDRAEPLKWKYGFYQDMLCQPLPPPL